MGSETVSNRKVFNTKVRDMKGFDLVENDEYSPDHGHCLSKTKAGDPEKLHDKLRKNGYRRPRENGYDEKQIHSSEETSERMLRSNGRITAVSGKAPEVLNAAMSALSKEHTSFSGCLSRF